MTLLVRVTAHDIKKGCRRQHNNCPIARAVKRNKGVSSVVVGSHAITYTKNNIYYTATLPKIARLFIQEFDEGKDCQPFEFAVIVTETPILSANAPNNDSFP